MPSLDQLLLPLAALVGTHSCHDGLDLCAYLPVTLRWFWISVAVVGDAEAYNGHKLILGNVTATEEADSLAVSNHNGARLFSDNVGAEETKCEGSHY